MWNLQAKFMCWIQLCSCQIVYDNDGHFLLRVRALFHNFAL